MKYLTPIVLLGLAFYLLSTANPSPQKLAQANPFSDFFSLIFGGGNAKHQQGSIPQ
ncbi:hypothetical protein [Kamptonema sp. UHCC 0994]|uniref:hypothetical protein n=1 Tax=Kamptonema sp. UHCC 0994 TaxID=3031329 RepID=UPI0023BAC13F|nr:hypothetical protein [Kamptonema sp. UHCC 0994]MDF0557053.1 hypothetical protein [Kamptonema sp. UHCC 0994]